MLRDRILCRGAAVAACFVAALTVASSASADDVLYYANIFNPDPTYGTINRVNADGSGPIVPLVDVGGGLRGIDVDTTGGKIYWTDVNNFAIRRANLDGSNHEDLITSGLVFPMNIEVHPPTNQLFWGDISEGYIGVAGMDGSNPQLWLNTPFHWGLAIDTVNGKVYWSTSDTMFKGRILRANLDGSNLETVVISQEPEFKPAHIALDVAGGKIYWTDYVVDIVRRSNLDGSNIEPLFVVGANENPRGIVVDADNGRVYWGQDTEFSGPNAQIMRMNLNGSGQVVLVPNTGLPQDIVLVSGSGAPCPADLNKDGKIDQQDLGILLADYGCTTPPCPGDITGDGKTDQADLGALLAVYGTTCP